MAKRYHNSTPETYSAERREDGSMISEDRGSIANLPQNIIMKHYSSPFTYLPEDYDDTLGGIDQQIGKDQSKRNTYFKPKKV